MNGEKTTRKKQRKIEDAGWKSKRGFLFPRLKEKPKKKKKKKKKKEEEEEMLRPGVWLEKRKVGNIFSTCCPEN